jgi:hypothetical protein
MELSATQPDILSYLYALQISGGCYILVKYACGRAFLSLKLSLLFTIKYFSFVRVVLATCTKLLQYHYCILPHALTVPVPSACFYTSNRIFVIGPRRRLSLSSPGGFPYRHSCLAYYPDIGAYGYRTVLYNSRILVPHCSVNSCSLSRLPCELE